MTSTSALALAVTLLSVVFSALATKETVPRSMSLSAGGVTVKLPLRLVVPGAAVRVISPSLTSVLSRVQPLPSRPEKL